mgnify:FL=1
MSYAVRFPGSISERHLTLRNPEQDFKYPEGSVWSWSCLTAHLFETPTEAIQAVSEFFTEVLKSPQDVERTSTLDRQRFLLESLPKFEVIERKELDFFVRFQDSDPPVISS